MTLQDVLAPLRLQEFLEHHVGEQHAIIRGVPGRFQSLLSWQELNDVLSRLRVDDNRVSLVQNGRGIPRHTYVHTSRNGRHENLIGPSLSKAILSGATLVVNAVDELFPAVRRLAESCEDVFPIYASANLYAGWRTDHGFDVHWDGHDTLIVQVKGRKDWKVWRPTRPHPVGSDSADVVPRPAEDPVWQGTLEDGDALYMPRGWWHVACPRDEPSVHVTLGLKHPTGLEMVDWAMQRVRDCADARMNVPFWKNESGRAAWVLSIRKACVAALSDDVLESYMASLEAQMRSRPIVRLPETVDRTGAHMVSERMALRLMQGRRLHIEPGNSDIVAFKVQGVEWKCQAALVPALAMLSHITPCTLAEMKAKVEERARPLLRPFIGALIDAGAVWAEVMPEKRNELASVQVSRG